MKRSTIRAARVALALAIALAATPSRTRAEAGSRSTSDGHRILISKDVGQERWAMNLDLNDGTMTGNVFFPGGGPPKFVWCERKGDDRSLDPVLGEIRYACRGAEVCQQAPCADGGWATIGEVSVPGSFFLPATDPFSPLRLPSHYCSEVCTYPEDIGGEPSFSIQSTCCNYVTLGQRTTRDIRPGDDLTIRLWHYQLTGPSSARAYLAVQINDRIVWEARLPLPCAGGITGFIPNGDCRDASSPAESDPYQFKADFDAPAGSVVYLHIQNHGDNSYNMIEASVEGRSFILSDAWTHVSKGLRVRPAGRPASTEGESGAP
jgi:hypothetical protein